MYIPTQYQATPQGELWIKGFSYLAGGGIGAILMFALHALNLFATGLLAPVVFWGTWILFYASLGIGVIGAGMLCWYYLWLHPRGRWITMKIVYLVGATVLGFVISFIDPISAVVMVACAIAGMLSFEDKLGRQG